MDTLAEDIHPIDAALAELATFIHAQTYRLKLLGWNYYTTGTAPETYKALKASTIDKTIPIASYGCDTSIYNSNSINEQFRFWHDCTHLALDANFSKQGEYAVIDQHMIEARAYGLSKLAMHCLYIDTKGQVDYYFKHKSFVSDQLSFLYACLSDDMATVINHKY